MRTLATTLALTLVWTILVPNPVPADDWPQILGPDRRGRANEEFQWQAEPKQLWQIPAGQGYAGPVVVGDKAILFDRQGGEERVRAVSRGSGKEIWSTEFPAYYRGGINPDSGPRCVPLVVNQTVVVYGAAGDAHALKLDSGEEIWSRELFKDYKGEEGYFGAGSTPIAFGDKVLFNVGGKSAGIVALSLKDGKTLWKATSEGASYASPVRLKRKSKDVALFATRLNVIVIDPDDGKVLRKSPFGKRGPTVNGATPWVLNGGAVFLTSSYGIGAKVLEVVSDPPKAIWENDTSLSSQYNSPVRHSGYFYGIHGREDIGTAQLRCVKGVNGEVKWSKDFGVAHLIALGDRILALNLEGELIAFEASTQEYKELNRAKVGGSTTRALPAYSNGVLFFRDGKNFSAVELK